MPGKFLGRIDAGLSRHDARDVRGSRRVKIGKPAVGGDEGRNASKSCLIASGIGIAIRSCSLPIQRRPMSRRLGIEGGSAHEAGRFTRISFPRRSPAAPIAEWMRSAWLGKSASTVQTTIPWWWGFSA